MALLAISFALCLALGQASAGDTLENFELQPEAPTGDEESLQGLADGMSSFADGITKMLKFVTQDASAYEAASRKGVEDFDFELSSKNVDLSKQDPKSREQVAFSKAMQSYFVSTSGPLAKVVESIGIMSQGVDRALTRTLGATPEVEEIRTKLAAVHEGAQEFHQVVGTIIPAGSLYAHRNTRQQVEQKCLKAYTSLQQVQEAGDEAFIALTSAITEYGSHKLPTVQLNQVVASFSDTMHQQEYALETLMFGARAQCQRASELIKAANQGLDLPVDKVDGNSELTDNTVRNLHRTKR